MKKLVAVSAVALAMAFSAPATFADWQHDKSHYKKSYVKYKKMLENIKKAKLEAKKRAEAHAKHYKKLKKHKMKKSYSVPEIDGAHAALAIALMGGIVAIRRERYKRSA